MGRLQGKPDAGVWQMVQQSPNVAHSDGNSQVLWEDGERVFSRGWRLDDNGNRLAVLLVTPAADHPSRSRLDRFTREYELKDELDSAWAARPLALMRDADRTVLVLDDPGGEPLGRLLGGPMEAGRFLRLAIAVTSAVGKLHQRGLIHKDIKPANIVVGRADGHVRLTGFGIASRLSRERQAPEAPETIAGTLAYMAPEQTGRMNRSIDARSDLYALGVTLYQMLTSVLPFTAVDPMEWVHCHIARKPVPPCERLESVPAPVSALVMKLLAKIPEDRYQTAGGVERDLRRCLAEWEARQRIDEFPLGLQDTPNQLLIPEKLYGRDREIATLLSCFDRITKTGVPELVLVSGYSGIGKSSIVNELQKTLLPARGLFVSGKFDLHKRDIPYWTLGQAFQGLVRHLLGKSDAELGRWRLALLEALGPDGSLMVQLVPELILVVGDQEPVADLPPQESQKRFQLLFRRFIGIFAQAEHPLVLFLDDLQWLDAATFDLLEDLLTRSDVHHLMLIGAYRDDEVDAVHPLRHKLDAMKNSGGKIGEIALAPLAGEHIGQLIADALRCQPDGALPLAELVHKKTGGNPFFAIQFLYTLADQGLLTFDYADMRWRWDLTRIETQAYTENVVDLMVGRVRRLPTETQKVLQQLACFGNSAQTALLSIVHESSEEKLHADLWEARRAELVILSSTSYKFMHDRIREAAYSLIPRKERAATHLRIGRLLTAHLPPDKQENTIFEIAAQFNRGSDLILSREEREQIAKLNLAAGKRAKACAVYASALSYLVAAASFLSESSWKRRRALIFEVELHRAECEFLIGDIENAEQRLAALSDRATNTLERAKVACLRADLYTAIGQNANAVAIGLDYLRHLGVNWSLHPTEDEARREYAGICSRLESRTIEDLTQLPLMSDPASLATIDVLMKIGTPAFFTDQNLWSLATCRTLNLSLDRGNSDGSCLAYVALGLIAANRFSDYRAAFRFGEIGCQLVERLRLARFQPRIYLHFGAHLMPYTKHVRAGHDLLRSALEIAYRNGDLVFAGYGWVALIGNLLAAGATLVDVQHEAEQGLEFARKMHLDSVIDWIAPLLGLIRTLRGSTPEFGYFDDGQFEESRTEHYFSSRPELAHPEGRYWIRKLQARFFAADYTSALEASRNAERLLQRFPSPLETADFHFYSALCQAASSDFETSDRGHRLETLSIHYERLQSFATDNPENFENRAALVGAEIARIDGRAFDAMNLYERAIRSAQANGFVHNEALANELASRFYTACGFEQIAHLYLRNARDCYLRWGADGKVRQLDAMYPRLRMEEPARASTSTIAASVEQLDLATVIKVSQAISGEIVLENLLETLMRTALEQAGAERGLLILSRGAEQRIAAEAMTDGGLVTVHLPDEDLVPTVLPELVLHYVLRTRESVILDDASSGNPFFADPYIVQRRARSILCLPLIKQQKCIGVLYLENNLTPNVFTPGRAALLKVFASQAAISLENSQLYREVADREGKIRRLVDANIIGVFIADREGRIIEANDAFLRVVGYGREDLVSGRVHWTELSPPEWRERDVLTKAELDSTGIVQPFEKEYFQKDGSRVPVLVGAALFKEGGDRLAFVLDLTERKGAEERLRRSEAWLSQAQRLSRSGNWVSNETTKRFVYWSDESYRIWGFDPLQGLPSREDMRQRIHPDDRDRVREALQDAVRRKSDFTTEFRILLPNGTVKYLEATRHHLFSSEGTLLESMNSTVDVTQRKLAEETLRASEAKFRAAIDGIAGLVAIMAPSGELESANSPLIEYFGRTVEELKNWATSDAVHPDDVPRALESYERSFAAGTPFHHEVRLRRFDGEYRWFENRGAPIRDESGHIARWYCLLTDIEDRTQALARLQQMQSDFAHMNRVSMMGELAASLSHEITQPIASARNNAVAAQNFLKMQPPDLGEVREALASAVGDTDRAGNIIDRIREHVKKAPPRNERFDLNVAINEMVVLARSAIIRHGVSVQTELSEGLVQIQGDRVQLQQVLLNLILNAAEAMGSVEEGPRELSISTEQDQEGVLVAVRDSGPGIDPAYLDRVFDAFYTTKSSGTGMGLSICRSIIHAHGGELWAGANEPRGAVFQFSLPGTDEEFTTPLQVGDRTSELRKRIA